MPGVVPQHSVPAASALPARGLHLERRRRWPLADNRDQAGNQLFYYVNNFHDYLRNTPGIDFGAALRQLRGRRPRSLAQVNDGAAISTRGGNGTDYCQQREHGHAARRHARR